MMTTESLDLLNLLTAIRNGQLFYRNEEDGSVTLSVLPEDELEADEGDSIELPAALAYARAAG